MSKTKITKKWFMTKQSSRKLLYKMLSALFLFLSVLSLSLFGFTLSSSMPSATLFVLSVLCLNHSRLKSVEDDVNEELNLLNLVQASEGCPTLFYDQSQKLIAVRLANTTYKNPNNYIYMGDNVFMAYFGQEDNLLVVVIEGSSKSKNQKAVAFRSLAKR